MPASTDIPYFPFDERGFRLTMGLAPLAEEQWIEPDADAADQLRLRAELLRTRRDVVLQYQDTATDACLELNRLLRRHLLEFHPQQVAGDEQQIDVTPTGVVLDPPGSGVEALEQLAHLAQDDFCVLSADEEPTVIAGLVCFPSHWRLAEKFGRTSDEIHAPVPGFDAKLSTPTNAILRKLQPDHAVWRINWSIDGSDALHTPQSKTFRADLARDNVLESTWLRLERQTLRRLPQTGAVVFTIRTYQHRLREVVQDPQRREHLTATLRSMPAETTEYKGLTAVLPVLLEALEDAGTAIDGG